MTLPIVTKVENASSTAKTAITRDELLSLYILKLDEEANYFKVSPTSPEEELCDCNKCQVSSSHLRVGYYEHFSYNQLRLVRIFDTSSAIKIIMKGTFMIEENFSIINN